AWRRILARQRSECRREWQAVADAARYRRVGHSPQLAVSRSGGLETGNCRGYGRHRGQAGYDSAYCLRGFGADWPDGVQQLSAVHRGAVAACGGWNHWHGCVHEFPDRTGLSDVNAAAAATAAAAGRDAVESGAEQRRECWRGSGREVIGRGGTDTARLAASGS